jgi:hypothetical protein
MTAEINEIGPVGAGEIQLPNSPAMSSMATQAGLVSLSTAGNAAALRVRQSTNAQARNTTSPQNRTMSVQ